MLYKDHKLPFSLHLSYTHHIKLVGGYPVALVRTLCCCDWIPAGNQLRQEGFISVCSTEVSDHGGKESGDRAVYIMVARRQSKWNRLLT